MSDSPLNQATALLHELTISNAPYQPGDCRDVADKIGARLGDLRDLIAFVLGTLESIQTEKMAAVGLPAEAHAVGSARIMLDRLLEF